MDVRSPGRPVIERCALSSLKPWPMSCTPISTLGGCPVPGSPLKPKPKPGSGNCGCGAIRAHCRPPRWPTGLAGSSTVGSIKLQASSTLLGHSAFDHRARRGGAGHRPSVGILGWPIEVGADDVTRVVVRLQTILGADGLDRARIQRWTHRRGTDCVWFRPRRSILDGGATGGQPRLESAEPWPGRIPAAVAACVFIPTRCRLNWSGWRSGESIDGHRPG